MTLRCKPGQMCRIINAENKENIGGVVQIVSLAPFFFERGYGPEWEAKAAYPMRAVRQETGFMGMPPDGIAQIPDAWLEPILPPEQPETVTNEETAEA